MRSHHLSGPARNADSLSGKNTEQSDKGAHSLLERFLLSQQVEENKAPITLRNYRYALRPFMAWCGERDLRELNSEDLQAYLAHVQRVLPNPFSRFGRIKPLKVFYAWLYARGYTAEKLLASAKLPRLPEEVGYTPSVAEVKSLLRSCRRDTFEGLRDHALVLLAFDGGPRANEMRTLCLSDVDEQQRVLRVIGKARPGQPPSVRFVPLSPAVLRALHGYLKARAPIPGEVLFCDKRGLTLPRRAFCAIMERLRRRAGLAGTGRGHRLRRAFTTEALRAGCPEEILRRILGHKDLRMLARYTALQTGDLLRFHDRTAPARYLTD